jgi:hypothetical protein
VATDTPAKPTPAAPAKSKRAAARRRAAAPKRTASKRATAAPKPDRNRAAVLSILEAQERTANALAGYQTRTAELSRIPGATTLANAQADLLRRVSGTYVAAARVLLK